MRRGEDESVNKGGARAAERTEDKENEGGSRETKEVRTSYEGREREIESDGSTENEESEERATRGRG